MACYEDDSIIQNTAIDLLQGKIPAKGKLPVTVCDSLKFGAGINTAKFFFAPLNTATAGIDFSKLNEIDSIALHAIHVGAMPGCVAMVIKDGKIAYHKAFGHFNYDSLENVTTAVGI